MKRQIDIDLLLPKIINFKTKHDNGTEKTFSANQVLWILEQEFALQNSMTDDTAPSSYGNSECQHVEIANEDYQRNVTINNCQSELFEIKGKMIVDEWQCSKA